MWCNKNFFFNRRNAAVTIPVVLSSGENLMKNVVVIEDEIDLAELLSFNLEREGYRVAVAREGLSGLETVKKELPDLVILDLMLPGMQGTEICREIRRDRRTSAIPVIMLTAKGEEIDRVVGLEVGADDYVTKPFSVRELMLRVKAVLRRTRPEPGAGRVIMVGPLTIDHESCTVAVNGREIPLTTTEFKLLHYLSERLGRVQSREHLLHNVWGFSYAGDTRTVDTHVTRLRTKLAEAGDLIKTTRGFGYKMEEE
jgi:two-component system phosphate regulon response regulator PhoB